MSNLFVVADDASAEDVLVERHRAAWDKTQRGRQEQIHGRQEWIEGTLELAVVLAEERKLLSADQDFSRWLKKKGLAEIEKNDRAALINMAADLGAARKMLEKTQRASWQEIWRHERQTWFPESRKPRQATNKRKSKADRQILDKIMDLSVRGFTHAQIAEDIGLTKDQVSGLIRRHGKTSAPTPPPKRYYDGYKGLDSKTLTREQVDPDFKGDAVQFASRYGHVLLHTKAELEEHKQQEVLRIWLAAIVDHQQSAKVLAAAELPNPDTLQAWLVKVGKADKLRTWLASIETAYGLVQQLRMRDGKP
jgi:hypothetical protein